MTTREIEKREALAKQGKYADAHKEWWLGNVRLILPNDVIYGYVHIRDGRIAGIHQAAHAAEMAKIASVIQRRGEHFYDGKGHYLFPGLIDIHCDGIEKEVQPRPNTLFPLQMAFYEFEKKLPCCGITTMYHSLSLGTGLSLRGEHWMVELLQIIQRQRQSEALLRHRVHLRYEVIYLEGIALAEQLVHSGQVDYLSYMNHAPGQGQYRAAGSFEAYVMKNQGVGTEEVKAIAERALARQAQVDWDRLRKLAEDAVQRKIAIASHDDDMRGTIDHALSCHATVSEFPLNLATAEYAHTQGMKVCVGAPNIVRGSSHDHNMRAMDGVAIGVVDLLCSDYYPATLLPAVFQIAKEYGNLAEAAAMVSLRPAEAVGIAHELGSIEVGKWADLVLVQADGDYPLVQETWTNGQSVYRASYVMQQN